MAGRRDYGLRRTGLWALTVRVLAARPGAAIGPGRHYGCQRTDRTSRVTAVQKNPRLGRIRATASMISPAVWSASAASLAVALSVG